mgnify:CR=1 FL=1
MAEAAGAAMLEANDLVGLAQAPGRGAQVDAGPVILGERLELLQRRVYPRPEPPPEPPPSWLISN